MMIQTHKTVPNGQTLILPLVPLDVAVQPSLPLIVEVAPLPRADKETASGVGEVPKLVHKHRLANFAFDWDMMHPLEVAILVKPEPHMGQQERLW